MIKPQCYSITVFTERWREIRNFYVNILAAKVISERTDRYVDLMLGGMPLTIRPCLMGEAVSYFHLYLSIKERQAVLDQLRRNGVIVLNDGPYANFRDPEGRLIKVSESEAVLFKSPESLRHQTKAAA
ncbi:MAG: hypothetical protein ABIT76_07155 [Chthoniobacterales bacterium]